MPSLSETFVISVAEAATVGTPAIATKQIRAAALLRRLGSRLVIMRDQALLNSALAALLQDDSRHVSLGAGSEDTRSVRTALIHNRGSYGDPYGPLRDGCD